MSVIATVVLPAEEFTLGAALTSDTEITLRLERVVPVGHTFIPYVWASDEAVENVETALRAEADVDAFEVVDRTNGDALVRIEWADRLDGFLDAVAGSNGTILEGVGEADTWRFQLRFDDHDALTAFYRRCREEGVPVTLERVHNPGVPQDPKAGFGLTETQRETLQVALEEGYFDVPRRINLVELSEQLGVSDSAVSQRLRRGVATLLATSLADAGADSDLAMASDRPTDPE